MTSEAILDIIVNLQDKTKGGLNSLEKNLDGVKEKAEGAGAGIKKLGGLLASGAALGAVVAGAGMVKLAHGMLSAVEAGSDVQESMSKFNVVFNDTAGTADKVVANLDKFAQQSGRSKYALRTMAAELGDTLKPMGFSVEEAGNLSTQITQLAVDLGSFNNMDPEEAFTRLQGTLIGNHANALAFGVVINEATLKEELAAMGADKLTGALLEQAKVQARINLLMKGTTDAQGDAIRTSDSWANQVIRLKSIWADTKADLGLKLMPVFEPLITALGDIASKYAPMAADALADLMGKVDVEKLQEQLDTFIKGLTHGEIIVGDVHFRFTPMSSNFVTVNHDDKGNITGYTVNKDAIIFPTFWIPGKFYWSNQEDFNDKDAVYQSIGIGKWMKGGSLVIDGVVMEKQLTFGDIYQYKYTNKEGLVYLKIGGFVMDPTSSEQQKGSMSIESLGLATYFSDEDGLLYLKVAGITGAGNDTSSTVADWLNTGAASIGSNLPKWLSLGDDDKIYMNLSGVQMDPTTGEKGQGDVWKSFFMPGPGGGVSWISKGDDGLLYLNLAGIKAAGDSTGDTLASWGASLGTELSTTFKEDFGPYFKTMSTDFLATMNLWAWPGSPMNSWKWPASPMSQWKWPSIPEPGWITWLKNHFGGGGGGSSDSGGQENPPANPYSDQTGTGRNRYEGPIPSRGDIWSQYDITGIRAAGGPVRSGTAYMVGERGRPELFVPDQNGYIYDGVGGGMGGSVTVNISANVSSNIDIDRLAYRVAEVVNRRSR